MTGHDPESVKNGDSRIEDYLDRICAPLVGNLPYERRQEIRAEIREHLDALTEASIESGHTPDKAVERALQQFGDPKRISMEILKSRNLDEGSLVAALRAALVGYGLTAICFLLFVVVVIVEDMQEKLQTLEWSGLDFFLLFMLYIGNALLTGISTGYRSRRYGLSGIAIAGGSIILATAVASSLAELGIWPEEIGEMAKACFVLETLWLMIGMIGVGVSLAVQKTAKRFRDRVSPTRLA